MLRLAFIFLLAFVARGAATLDTLGADEPAKNSLLPTGIGHIAAPVTVGSGVGVAELKALYDTSASSHIFESAPTPLDAGSTPLPSIVYLRFNHECRGGAACAFSPAHVYCGYLPGTEHINLADPQLVPVHFYTARVGAPWRNLGAPDLCRDMNASAAFSAKSVWACSAELSRHNDVRIHNLSMLCDRPVTSPRDMVHACTVTYGITRADRSNEHGTPALFVLVVLAVAIYVAGAWALLPAFFVLFLDVSAMRYLPPVWMQQDLRATF